MCSRYHLDPASEAGIEDDYLAHCFREAVAVAGQQAQETASKREPREEATSALTEHARRQGAAWAQR